MLHDTMCRNACTNNPDRIDIGGDVVLPQQALYVGPRFNLSLGIQGTERILAPGLWSSVRARPSARWFLQSRYRRIVSNPHLFRPLVGCVPGVVGGSFRRG